jgi:phosphatidylglycerol:prolipoprotein diacylglycerol transferase
MLWIALMVGLFRTTRAARRIGGIEVQQVVDLALYTMLGGIVMAHVVSVLLELPTYIHDPSQIGKLWSGMLSPGGGLRGLSFHGGLIGAIGVVLLYTKRHKLKFMDVADLMTPALALGYAITRIGCFLNGCCYGVPTSLPWGVRFQPDPFSSALTPPSHPTQLYATAINVVLFFILVGMEKRRRYSGQIFMSYLAMYSVYRFLIEILRRGVTAEISYLGLTQGQWASLAILAIVLPILWMRRKVGTDAIATGLNPGANK